MYEFFFGFKEKPFSITPDPKFLYLSKKHREALAGLIYGMKGRRGLIVLSGELGTGKTTLIKALSEKLDQNSQVACVFNPELSVVGFFMTVCEDLGIRVRGTSRMSYLTKLHDFLMESHNKGKTTSLILDEAQNLAPPLLEEIRMLTNLETSNEKLLQIFLVGEPELDDLLNQRQWWKLKQRISIRYSLLPLDHEETRGYIETRLRVAGAKRQSCFTEGAVRRIYEHSGGVPLRINNICEDSLLLGYTLSAPIINKEVVTKCIAGITPGALQKTTVQERPDIRSRPEEKSYPRASSISILSLTIILIGLLVVGVALFVSAMFGPTQRLLKPFEAAQSLFHRKEKPAAEDARLAKQKTIEDKTTGPLVAMKTETAPESEIAKTSPDTVSEGESTQGSRETEPSQAESGPESSASLLSTVEEGNRVDEVIRSEPGTVYALDQIQKEQVAPLPSDGRPTDSVPEAEIQEEEGDILLGVGRAGEDRLAFYQGTVEVDSLAEETPQEETPETVARPDESFRTEEEILIELGEIKGPDKMVEEEELPETLRTEEEILIELGEIKGPDKMVEEEELPETLSVADVLKSEADETMKPLSAEPSEVTPRKPTAGERTPEEHIGDERLGQAPVIETRGTAKPLATEVSKEAEEKSLEDSQEAALKEELREDKDLVKIEDRDVRQFFANYMERYNRRDIDGFLSLFSRRAIQNGKDGFSRIEKMYSDFFDQSQELRYDLEEIRIEIHQNVLISGVFFRNAAEVEARYEIDQVLEKGREKKVWKGDISWILTRENGVLRVVYLNYQASKSPSKERSPAKDEGR